MLEFRRRVVELFQGTTIVGLSSSDALCWFLVFAFYNRLMFQLRCTVRDCQQLLEQRERELVCHAGHCFDQAKQGYWNLLQPQDKKSKNPGDSEDAVLARHRWLQHGHAISLIETLRPWFAANGPEANQRTLDLGCGEGSFGPALFPNEADSYCGIDLSKRAIKLATRGWPEATWVLANADRVFTGSRSKCSPSSITIRSTSHFRNPSRSCAWWDQCGCRAG